MTESATPDNNIFTVYSGNGLNQVAKMRISENGVFWGNTLLYGAPDEANGTGFLTESFHDFRLVYKSDEGTEGFYYLWLGDQLIGEDLVGDKTSGVVASYKDMILLGKILLMM